MTRFERFFIVAVLVVAVGGTAGVLAYAAHVEAETSRVHPTDEQMIRGFEKHREQFAQLLQMYRADVALEFRYWELWADKWPCRPSSEDTDDAALKQYLELRRRLGVFRVRGWDSGKVEIITSTCGLSVSGSSKGYVYSTGAPSPLVDDTERDAAGFIGATYRHIDGDWYLFYEWDT